MTGSSRPLNRVLTAALAAVLVATAAPPSPVRAAVSDWTHDGYGPGNTGYNPAESRINRRTVDRLTQRWSVELAAGEPACTSYYPPVVVGDRVFAIDGVGVTAYRARTGRVLWRNAGVLDYRATRPLMAVRGLVVAAGYTCYSNDPSGQVTALDARTGAQRWRVSQGVAVDDVVGDGRTIVTSGECAICDSSLVTAYRARDGRQAWRKGDMLLAGAVMARGTVLLRPRTGGSTTAVDAATGVTRWRSATDLMALATNPAGTDLYAQAPGGRLVALRAGSGRVRWSVPSPAGTTLAADGRRVYASHTSSVTAYDARTGRRLWRVELAEPGRPVRAGGLLYVTWDGRPPAILSPVDGALVWGGAVLGAAEKHLVVSGGQLYTFRPAAGGRHSIRAYRP